MHCKMYMALVSILSVFFLFPFSISFAQDTPLRAQLLGDAIIVDDGDTTNIGGVSVAHNSTDNEYRIVWFDSRITGQNDVYSQRMDVDGTLLGSNVTIISGADSQSDTGIAYDPLLNQYLITWKNQSGAPGSPGFNHTFGAIASADGGLVGSALDLSNAGLERTVVFNPSANEYFFTARNFAGGGTAGIYGRRVSSSGAIVGSNITLSTLGAPAPCGAMAYDSNHNRYLSTWRNQSDSNLKARLVNADGTFAGAEFLVSSLFPESGLASGVAFDPIHDRYLVLFSEFCAGGIYGQFVDSSGALSGPLLTLVETTAERWQPSLAYDPVNAVYLVAWSGSDTGSMTAQLLYDDGSLAGEAVELIHPGFSSLPLIAADTTAGGFLVAWADRKYDPPEAFHVLGQRIAVAPSYLVADQQTLSARYGGIVNLQLAAGAANGNRNYIVLGSASGTSPGTLLPGGQATLPLNWDIFTDLVLQLLNTPVFAGFLGTLDSSGEAGAQSYAPPLPAAAVGTQLDFAFTMNNPFDFASNAEHVEIVN
ncbi:MAG: hypothetical protein ABIK28_19465 [Planctomycetota bacterium]